MNKEEFNQILKTIKLNCDDDKFAKLEMYANFLIEYNKHTNLTSIVNLKEIFLKHFFDSLTLNKIINLNEFKNLLDIGSGAGFPGMVLAIFYPKLKITLLDSNNKKIIFLNKLCQKLNLKNVEIIYGRAEEVTKQFINHFDVVTARAVTNLRVLSEISIPLVKKDGYFIPLKGNVNDEIKLAENTIKKINGQIITKESFDLPENTGKRTIIKIKKIENCDINKLRQYNQILKSEIK